MQARNIELEESLIEKEEREKKIQKELEYTSDEKTKLQESLLNAKKTLLAKIGDDITNLNNKKVEAKRRTSRVISVCKVLIILSSVLICALLPLSIKLFTWTVLEPLIWYISSCYAILLFVIAICWGGSLNIFNLLNTKIYNKIMDNQLYKLGVDDVKYNKLVQDKISLLNEIAQISR